MPLQPRAPGRGTGLSNHDANCAHGCPRAEARRRLPLSCLARSVLGSEPDGKAKAPLPSFPYHAPPSGSTNSGPDLPRTSSSRPACTASASPVHADPAGRPGRVPNSLPPSSALPGRGRLRTYGGPRRGCAMKVLPLAALPIADHAERIHSQASPAAPTGSGAHPHAQPAQLPPASSAAAPMPSFSGSTSRPCRSLGDGCATTPGCSNCSAWRR